MDVPINMHNNIHRISEGIAILANIRQLPVDFAEGIEEVHQPLDAQVWDTSQGTE